MCKANVTEKANDCEMMWKRNCRKEKSRFVNGEKVRLWIENEMIHTQRFLVVAEEEIEILERFT